MRIFSTAMQAQAAAATSIQEILNEAYADRVGKNPRYSLRAMARDLEVSPTFLSLVLNGKKKISFRRALQMSKALGLDEGRSEALLRAAAMSSVRDGDSRRFLERSFKTTPKESVYPTLELERFRALSDWYHVAILDLTLVKGFVADANWVAEQLGIPASQVRVAVSRLERLGLLEIREGRWLKTEAKLAVPTTRSDPAIRNFHHQMMERAQLALKDPESFAEREIAGATIAINPERLPLAKKRIQAFRRELMELLIEGECTELYQFNQQLFRLTKRKLTGEKS